eukprot:CAMPEP_0184327862 /NCGR_PEP_ID=MMETSP1049-20130417/143317_1 /TAXON_ID=77928 /ORGANISM="Proteomonas sulcata, Strain CCMP704" /LENGTH=214 /DNA_ID=CAMNT_0026650139 /DNA_START=12 /DNA_END=657 /DNA_ORIENTATION=-
MRQQSRSIEWHLPPSLNNVCYIAQEGSALWAGTVSGQLVILDLRTGVVRCAWQGHDGAVTGIESLDNGTVTTTSSDRTIATWNCAASPANDVGLAWDNAWGSSPEHIQWWGKENQDKLYLTEPLIGLARFGGRYSAALASGVVLAKPPGEIYQSRLKDSGAMCPASLLCGIPGCWCLGARTGSLGPAIDDSSSPFITPPAAPQLLSSSAPQLLS